MSAWGRIREVGAWLTGTGVKPSEFEQMDANLAKAPNFEEGGTYAPSAPLIVGGESIRVQTPAHADQVTPRTWVEAQSQSAYYQVGGVKAANDLFVLNTTVSFANPAEWPSLEDATELQFPYGGVFFVVLYWNGQSSDEALNKSIQLSLRRGGSGILTTRATRFSDNASNFVGQGGSRLLQITDPPNQKLDIQNISGSGNVTLATSHLSIMYRGPVPEAP